MKSEGRAFRKKVLDFYKKNGRHNLPWRKTTNPYRILVSEIMLQQTQVDRVIPKYKEFLQRFPTTKKLAEATLPEVLRLWSGLGYNRRARMLHGAAKQVVAEHGGRFPETVEELEKLPGVGHYTARAVAAFAYNQPVVMIETNIRSVFLHEFFKDKHDIPDSKIFHLNGKFLDEKNPREWYAALMDYGAHLKKAHPNPSRRSKHHTTQAKFKGSLREVRGRILPLLFTGAKTDILLAKETKFPRGRIREALLGLASDGLVTKEGRAWVLVT